MNQIRHLVIFLFFFQIWGTTRYGGNPRDEVFYSGPMNVLTLGCPFPSLQCSEGGGGGGGGARRETFLSKGSHSKWLPLPPWLDAWGAGPKTSLGEEGCTGLSAHHQFQPAASLSASSVGDELPGIKFRRSAVMKCSPSTISEGRGRGIIRTL